MRPKWSMAVWTMAAPDVAQRSAKHRAAHCPLPTVQHTVVVGDRCAAGSANFIDHQVGRRATRCARFALHAGAQIVDNHLSARVSRAARRSTHFGPTRSKRQRVRTSQATAGTGHYHNTAPSKPISTRNSE